MTTPLSLTGPFIHDSHKAPADQWLRSPSMSILHQLMNQLTWLLRHSYGHRSIKLHPLLLLYKSLRKPCSIARDWVVLQHSLGSDEQAKSFEEYSRLQGEGKVEEAVECLRKLNLQYFAPKEVANLMCFPTEFNFPPSLSRNQCYKVIGNSLNVHVAAVLMTYLFSWCYDDVLCFLQFHSI